MSEASKTDAKASTTTETEEQDPRTATSASYYADSYAHYGIHEEMLKDEVRTMSYRNAIYSSKHLFKDAVVLDVGCGTGILSMFAAKAGAKHVYGVDMSRIIHSARKIVEANGLSDKVTLIKGKIEEVELPVEKVDIIISEWMGYALLYESMLDSVLVARDRWLKEGGVLMPDKATIRITGIEDEAYKNEKIMWWENVYGFDMSVMRDQALLEPLVDIVNPESVACTDSSVLNIDLNSVTVGELDFDEPFEISAVRDDYVHALVLYFDTTFSRCHKPVFFSTGPKDTYTHWKQTVLYLKDPLIVKAGDHITGRVKFVKNAKNPRDLDITLTYNCNSEAGEVKEVMDFRMR